MASQILILLITGIMFLLFIAWIFWMVYWMLGKFGLWKWATFRRLKRKFGENFVFKDDAIEWCLDKIQKKWKYKDVRKFIGYEPNGRELHYTFLTFDKISKQELDMITERRLKDNGEQTIGGFKEEVERTLPEIPRERDEAESS